MARQPQRSHILLAGMLVIFEAGSAVSQVSEPIRSRRNIGLSLTCSAIMFPSDLPLVIPTPGIRFDYSFNAHFSIDVQADVLVILNSVHAGGRGYLLKGALSPYAFGRIGVFFAPGFSDQVSAAINGGAGIEYLASFGLVAFLELGIEALSSRNDWTPTGRGTLGIGYRF